MNAKYVIAGAAVLGLFLASRAKAANVDTSAGGVDNGPNSPNPSDTTIHVDVSLKGGGATPTGTTASTAIGLSGPALAADSEIRAEFYRIANAAITPTSTLKNHYDWIYSLQVNAARYRETTGVALPVENEIKAWIDANHDAAYPGFLAKYAEPIGSVVGAIFGNPTLGASIGRTVGSSSS